MALEPICKRRKINDEEEKNEESSVTDKECWINRMPDEVLRHIFSFLPYYQRIKIERVCRRWRYINTKTPWTNVSVLNLSYEDNHRLLRVKELKQILKRCGSTLRRIRLSHQSKINRSCILLISTYCSKLTSLDLSFTYITNRSLLTLAKRCEKLTDIRLNFSFVTDVGLRELFSKCKIRRINLFDCLEVTGAHFNLLANYLQSVNVMGCDLIGDEGLQALSQCQNLRELFLLDAHLRCSECSNLFKSLGPQLVFLSIGTNSCHTKLRKKMRQTLELGLPYCKNLQQLNFLDIGVNDKILNIVSKHCQQIHTLCLEGAHITYIGLCRLMELSKLRNLNLSHVRNDSKKFKFVLIALNKKANLELLVARNSFMTDAACKSLIKSSERLKYLDVSDNGLITDKTVVTAKRLCETRKEKLFIFATGTSVLNYIKSAKLDVVYEYKACSLEGQSESRLISRFPF